MRYDIYPWLLVAWLALLPLTAGTAAAQAGQPPASLSAHVDDLGSFEYESRTRAARLLRRALAADAVPLLAAAARAHEDEFVRFRALVLLTGFNDRGTGALMRELLGDPNDRVREVAYTWFEQHPEPMLTASLLSALQHESAEFVRPALVAALAALGDDAQVQRALLFEVGRGMDFFRSAVIETLGRHRAAYAADAIAGVARSPGPLQFDAVLALGRLRDRRVVPVLESLGTPSPDVGLARSVGLCLAADRCDTHLADALRSATAPDASRTLVRAAVTALVVTALDGDDPRAVSVLFELASSAGGMQRDEVSRGFGVLAVRGTDQLLGWLDRIPEDARSAALDMVADGAGRLEEHLLKEQLFATLRAAYWRAPDGATLRDTAAALIDKLEF